MIEKLKDYLNGTMSYFEASTVFFAFCKNKVLAGNLFKSDKKQNQEKLRYEIKKLLDLHKIDYRIEKSNNPTIQQSNNPIIQQFHTELSRSANNLPTFSYQSNFSNSKSNSPLKDRVLDERKALYLKRGHLHGRMHEVTTDEARYDLAESLFILQQKIDEYNRDLRQIEAGEIPNRYLSTTATGAEVLRRRNLMIYIARIKKELPSITDAKELKKKNKKLEDYENELANL